MDLCALEQQSENLECEQQKKYCGVVRVHGDQLTFFPGFKSADANVNRSKIDRLKNIFQTEGCDRVNPTHQIPGNISASQLAIALQSLNLTADGLRASSPTDPPFLYLPQGTFIHCLRGRSRIKALRELKRPDWWTIKLYVDLSSAAQNLLSEGHDNDGPYSDGYIYAKVCEHQTTIQEKQWLSRLSKSKQGILKRLRRHPILGPAYANVLLQIPGMQEGLQIGTLPETISAKNYENVVRCLVQIIKVWVFIMGSEANLRYVDEDAVRELELRCPGISLSDEQHVTSVIRGGMAFHDVTDKAERENLLERTKLVYCLIPSLRTFQMDFKYVRRCTHVVKQLLLGDAPLDCTVEQTAFAAFRRRKAEADRSDPVFQGSYKLLCLHVMQNLTELSGEYPLLEDNEKPPSELVPDPRAWFDLAKRASDLGFESQMITNRLSNDPDRAEAKRALLNARKPDLYSYESSSFDTLITTITDTFNKAHMVQKSQQQSMLTCSHPGEPLDRRCGRQYSSAYFRDRHSLTVESLTCSVEKNADITSLFVRRSVFLTFWGLHDTDGQERFNISNEDEIDMGESPLESGDADMPDLPAFTRRKRPVGQPRAAGSGRSGLKLDDAHAPVKPVKKVATPAKGAIQPTKIGKSSQPSKPGSKSIQKRVEQELNKANQGAQKANQEKAPPTASRSGTSLVEIRNKSDNQLIRQCQRQSVIQAVKDILNGNSGAHAFSTDGRGILLDDCVNVDCILIGPRVEQEERVEPEEEEEI